LVSYDCGRNSSPNIGRAEIAENKIKWYLTVITIDHIDQKKTGVLHLRSGVLKTLLHPFSYAYGCTAIPKQCTSCGHTIMYILYTYMYSVKTSQHKFNNITIFSNTVVY
jgi:hypothetical protein